MQENNDTILTFASRVERLAKKLGGYSEVAAKMGISRQTLYVAMGGEPSLKTLKKLTDVELSVLSEKTDALEEPPPATYGGATVTRAQIEAQLKALLDAAERVPGGLGWANVQIAMHLRPDQLRAIDPSYNPLEELRRRVAALQGNQGGENRRQAS